MTSFPMIIRFTDTGAELFCASGKDIPPLREFVVVKTWKVLVQ